MSYLDFFSFKSLLIFLLIILINLLILNFRNNVAKLLNIFDYPNERKIHKNPTPLVGGHLFIYNNINYFSINFAFFNITKIKFSIYLLFYIIFFPIGIWDLPKLLAQK